MSRKKTEVGGQVSGVRCQGGGTEDRGLRTGDRREEMGKGKERS
jgi:hypothetical protein